MKVYQGPLRVLIPPVRHTLYGRVGQVHKTPDPRNRKKT